MSKHRLLAMLNWLREIISVILMVMAMVAYVTNNVSDAIYMSVWALITEPKGGTEAVNDNL